MTDELRQRITTAVERAFAAADLPWPPVSNGLVPLDLLINTHNVYHNEIANLTRERAKEHLARYGISCDRLSGDQTPLAGFIVVAPPGGAVFVSQDDNLPRRRFSAAHELGHLLLHFDPEISAAEPFHMDDGPSSVVEYETEDDQDDLAEREREANRFAAELLMPEPVVRRVLKNYCTNHKPTEPFLTSHLASDLLVSRDAARWRLRELGVRY